VVNHRPMNPPVHGLPRIAAVFVVGGFLRRRWWALRCASLPGVVKCRTTEGVHQPAARLEPTTAVAAPSSLAEKLAAYLDAVGTMVIAPVGFECAAAIGVDGSENVTAYPKGGVNPEENPSEPRSGTVVSMNIATACQGCIAEAVCTLFPEHVR
jgi:hypothetical protein